MAAARTLLEPWRCDCNGSSVCHTGYSFSTTGSIVLERGGTVSGMVNDDPIVEGKWTPSSMHFKVMYNATILFEYELQVEKQRGGQEQQGGGDDAGAVVVSGTWQTDYYTDRESESHSHGTVSLTLTDRKASVWHSSLTDDMGDGNSACAVRQVAEAAVPCSVCSSQHAKLTFFEMTVPHFGKSELVSFSCGTCRYKYNKMRTAVGQLPGPRGRTHTLRVQCPDDLRRHVVVSDTGNVSVPALNASVGSQGRYTTVEGLVKGFLNGLLHVALASDDLDGAVPVALGGGQRPLDALEARIDTLIENCEEHPFDVIIMDPLATSFISGVGEQLQVSEYDRTAEEDEELGITTCAPEGGGWDPSAEEEDAVVSTALLQHSAVGEEASADVRDHLKACEALAAEYTRTYDGEIDEESDDDDDDLGTGLFGAEEVEATNMTQSVVSNEEDGPALADLD